MLPCEAECVTVEVRFEEEKMGEVVRLKAADDHEFAAYHVAASGGSDLLPEPGPGMRSTTSVTTPLRC